MKLKVKKIGENPGFCREYWQNIENKNIYARTLAVGKFPEEWHSTDCNGGEPECPLRKDLQFEFID